MPVRIRTLVPLTPSPDAKAQCADLLRRITSAPPGSARANRARWDLEHLLMQLLHGGGMAAVEETVGIADARPQLTIVRQPGALMWTGHDDQATANLRLSVTDGDLVKSASVTWTAVPKPPAPPRTKTHRLQAEFYMAAGRSAYGQPPRPLAQSSDDARLRGLDDRFYEVPEDLAIRTMTRLAAGASRRGATARTPRAPAPRRTTRGSASRRPGRK